MKCAYIQSLIILLLICIRSSGIHAQDKDSVVIYFRFDTEKIDSSYLTNKENIARIARITNGTGTVDSITLRVWSSPEGGIRRNTELAGKRAEEAKRLYLTGDGRKDSLMDGRIRVITVAENWQGLKDAVERYYFRHDREKVLRILNTEGISDETRKWRLGRLDKGYTWDFLRRIYMPMLRTAVWSEIHIRAFDGTPLTITPPNRLTHSPAHLQG